MSDTPTSDEAREETRERVAVLLANLEASVQAAKEARNRKLAVDARDTAGAGAAEGDDT